ncbi:hypothetical protein WJX77_004512 [Trebouxia sp. C0004]
MTFWGSANLLLTAGADMAVALQYGYDYDINSGITTGTTASLTTSVGIQPSFTAGLQGSVLWDLASGYVYATAQTLAHVDLNISIETSGGTAVLLPSDGLVCGDCNAFPVVFVGVYIGVDQASMGIGLAAALSSAIPLLGWSAAFSVGLGGVSVVDFNAQRQAPFLQATAGFMDSALSSLTISSLNGVVYNHRSAPVFAMTCLALYPALHLPPPPWMPLPAHPYPPPPILWNPSPG